jgi:hypothetical protein
MSNLRLARETCPQRWSRTQAVPPSRRSALASRAASRTGRSARGRIRGRWRGRTGPSGSSPVRRPGPGPLCQQRHPRPGLRRLDQVRLKRESQKSEHPTPAFHHGPRRRFGPSESRRHRLGLARRVAMPVRVVAEEGQVEPFAAVPCLPMRREQRPDRLWARPPGGGTGRSVPRATGPGGPSRRSSDRYSHRSSRPCHGRQTWPPGR